MSTVVTIRQLCMQLLYLRVATTIQGKQINYLDIFIGFIRLPKAKLVN